MSTLGKRIRAGREHKGWTLDDLSSESGLSKGFLSDMENDKRNVSASSLITLSDALDLSVEWILRGHKQARVKCPLCHQGWIDLA